jgi:exopolyphosphatase/guanosine-5'-triphosphate,3'-diphosphate pyrophosphatase
LNTEEFVRLVEERTNCVVEVLSADDEGSALHQGVLGDFDSDSEQFWVLNVGGVSTEVTLGTKTRVERKLNLRFGALSLTERFLRSDPPSMSQIDELHAHVAESLAPAAHRPTPALKLIHTGGELDYLLATACPVWPSSVSPTHPVQTDVPTFSAFANRLRKLTLGELRCYMPGNPRWMDGAIATNELTLVICEFLQVGAIIPSNRNLADGLLLRVKQEAGAAR